MGRLKKVILQLSQDDYEGLDSNLIDNKADKFRRLLQLVREDNSSYDQIQEELGVNSSAFYTLKSRLYDKIQEYLLDNMEGPKIDLLKKIANIPNLVFGTPKATAMAILSKLEKDLKDFDMPHQLTTVYGAFKKLHLHSPKYYDYAQLYNRHVAYTLAHDKAEDLLADFHKLLGEYYISKDDSHVAVLTLLKKEMENITKLYESHHMYLYQGIINVSYELFLPRSMETDNDEAVEDILTKCSDLISAYPKDANYQYLNKVINFLSFEYYHKLDLPKKEAEYFEVVSDSLSVFLLNNFCCFSSKFLCSKVERSVLMGTEGSLYEESLEVDKNYYPNKVDVPNFINYYKFKAMSAYYSDKFDVAITTLNELLNEISFKNYGHAEIEIKLLLSLCYSMVNKYDVAWGLIRSASRKARELGKERDYENVSMFVKMLKAQLGSNRKSLDDKLFKLRDRFMLLNQGEVKMLEYLRMDDTFIKTLAQSIK